MSLRAPRAAAAPSHDGRARGWLLALVALWCMFTETACTTSKVASWYVTREIDSFVDLKPDQRPEVRAHVDRLIEVIRKDDLPRWLYFMRLVRDTIARGEAQTQIEPLQQRLDGLLDGAANRLIPQLAELFARLDDGQIAHFEQSVRERLDEVYEEQKLPPGERRQKVDDELLEGLEKSVGELREDQERTILTAAHALPEERAIRYRIDRERNAAFAKLLRTHPGAAALAAEMHRMWDTRYEVPGTDRSKATRRAEQRNFLLVVDSTLSPEQRKHAVETLNDRIRMLKRFLP